jgi:hypothetical protein
MKQPSTNFHGKTILVILAFLSCLSVGFSQANSDASAYLEAVGVEYQKISKDMMAYISAANHGKSARKIEKKRTDLVLQMKESEKLVRKMKPYKGDNKLRDSVAAFLRISIHVMNEDYGKVVDLEEIAEQSYDAMEAYLMTKEKAGDKIGIAQEAVSREYDRFAAANSIRLIDTESKLEKKLQAAGEVNSYHNKIYLLFFKSYKNEAFMLDAMNKGAVGAIEQTRNALATSATDDLAKIGSTQGFKGDLSLKNATQQMILFYKTEATTKVPDQIEYFMAKEKFDKIQKAMDSKNPSDRTQEEIDLFNQAVKDFNAKVKESNDVNNEMNKKRSALLKAWNETSEAFLHKHTP